MDDYSDLAREAECIADLLGIAPPNALGFLRRIPGTAYWRRPPTGVAGDAPSHAELVAFVEKLKQLGADYQ